MKKLKGEIKSICDTLANVLRGYNTKDMIPISYDLLFRIYKILKMCGGVE
jgi:hypothetical protein